MQVLHKYPNWKLYYVKKRGGDQQCNIRVAIIVHHIFVNISTIAHLVYKRKVIHNSAWTNQYAYAKLFLDFGFCWYSHVSVCTFTPPPPFFQTTINQEDIYEALQKMDKNHDGQLNVTEFSQSVAILAQGYIKYGKSKGKVHHWSPSHTFLKTS